MGEICKNCQEVEFKKKVEEVVQQMFDEEDQTTERTVPLFEHQKVIIVIIIIFLVFTVCAMCGCLGLGYLFGRDTVINYHVAQASFILTCNNAKECHYWDRENQPEWTILGSSISYPRSYSLIDQHFEEQGKMIGTFGNLKSGETYLIMDDQNVYKMEVMKRPVEMEKLPTLFE
jgi:hypothetical protein